MRGTFKAAIVQGNIGQDVKWDESFKMMTVNKYYRLSFGLAQNADIIIWPETAMPFLLDREPAAYKYVKAVPVMLKSRFLYGTVGMLSTGNLLNTVHYIDPERQYGRDLQQSPPCPFRRVYPDSLVFPVPCEAHGHRCGFQAR